MTSPKESGTPGTITAGFWLVVAGMALVVLTPIYLYLNKQVLIDAQVQANTDPQFTPAEIQSAVTVIIVTTLAVNLLLTALAVFFAHRVRTGVRRSRTGLLITLLIALFFQLAVDNVLGLVPCLVAIAGLVLFYFRQSSDYLTESERAE
ncbi:hypothetical protein ABZ345_04895 [Lentzea sp. NPDC005914]|uniref:hypothetical protein n=1 Tax=Lentzea sp. NPDC005914 TaxID=3154572 RepID=UPI0033C1DCC1